MYVYRLLATGNKKYSISYFCIVEIKDKEIM